MEIVVTGGTGFIGGKITEYLKNKGYDVIALGKKHFKEGNICELIEGKEIVMNFMGTSIAGRWTRKKKKGIYESRVLTTRRLIEEMRACRQPVKTYIQVSAVGIYDNIHEHDEKSKLYAKNFLTELIIEWEKEAFKMQNENTRCVIIRLGIVLDKNGGFIKSILYPFKIGTAVFLGKGNQGFSFIHMEDLLRLNEYIIDNEDIKGIINAVSPQYTTMRDVTNQLCLILKPLFKINIPKVILNIIFGEGAIVFNEGQKVIPKAIMEKGFKFKHCNIISALNEIVETN